jgi:hypothetical protein
LKKLKPEVREMIKIFGLPDKCPVEKVRYLIYAFGIVNDIFRLIANEMRGWFEKGKH